MNTHKKIIVAILLLFIVNSTFAQDNNLITAFNKSLVFEYKKDYSSAIVVLKDAYETKSYEANMRMGWLYYLSAQYNESINFYKKAIDLMPNAIEPKIGYLYPALAKNANEGGENIVNQYAKILELNPTDINANYQTGFYNYNKGNEAVAQKYFQKIIDLYPSGYDYYLRIAWAKIAKSNPVSDLIANAFSKSYEFEAKGDYLSAITTLKDIYDSKYYDLNLRLGYLNNMVLQYVEAVKYYKIAIDLKPNSIEPRLAYVAPAYQLGNKDDVFNQYKKIIELDPHNTTALYQIGLAYYYKKDYANACANFEKIVALYPFTYDGLLMLAWSNYRLNKNTTAETLFNKVLMLSPNDKSALEGLKLMQNNRSSSKPE